MSLYMSIIGMIVLLSIAVLLSDNRKAINYRTVGGALGIQILLGVFILYIPSGRDLLYAASQGVTNIMSYSAKGTEFLFGSLVNFSVEGIGFIFAFQVLPVIIFVSALVSTLYYLGIMQMIIRVIGGGLQRLLKTSPAESMSAAANIFLGPTDSPLLIKPFVPKMTNSELFAVMCGGLASIAGSVLMGYAAMGVPMEYLLAASFMAAPGGLLFAKIIKPEVDTLADGVSFEEDSSDDAKPANIIDAAAGGITNGLQLALMIGAMLIGFIAMIALINGLLGGVGGLFGMPELTLEFILGIVFSPLAFLIGIPWEEASIAGSFIGQKLIVNEFVAYSNFAPYLTDSMEVILSEKSKAIISFALCGFANLGSVAILLGGLGTLAPNRRHDIARLSMKAVAAGSLSNLMSATIAGLFLSL